MARRRNRAQAQEAKLEDERFELRHGGILRYEVWGYVEGGKTVVTRYNIAYINWQLCQKDNGRVLGYDNAHGAGHHRHYMGKVTSVKFVTYQRTVEDFEAEYREILEKHGIDK
jgi:hypothetical protein